jgi:hypothetical protein
MAFFNYEVAVGWDTDPGTNVEDWFPHAFRGKRVPLGSVTNKDSGGYETTDGWRMVELFSEWTLWEYLDAYVTAIFGDWDGPENVEVTLRHRNRDNTFTYYNALAHMPSEEKGDYEHHTTTLIFDIRLRFTIISEAA